MPSSNAPIINLGINKYIFPYGAKHGNCIFQFYYIVHEDKFNKHQLSYKRSEYFFVG